MSPAPQFNQYNNAGNAYAPNKNTLSKSAYFDNRSQGNYFGAKPQFLTDQKLATRRDRNAGNPNNYGCFMSPRPNRGGNINRNLFGSPMANMTLNNTNPGYASPAKNLTLANTNPAGGYRSPRPTNHYQQNNLNTMRSPRTSQMPTRNMRNPRTSQMATRNMRSPRASGYGRNERLSSSGTYGMAPAPVTNNNFPMAQSSYFGNNNVKFTDF